MRWFLAFLLVLAVACEPQKGSTLESVEARMQAVVGTVPLGDRSGFTFEPLHDVDWFLLVPANATQAMFAAAGLAEALKPAPAELLGKPEPLMATIDDGKITVRELPLAFQVRKVMAKRGKNTHGIRFVRLMGSSRSYQIESLD